MRVRAGSWTSSRVPAGICAANGKPNAKTIAAARTWASAALALILLPSPYDVHRAGPSRSTQRRPGRLSGMDARCLRFLRAGVRPRPGGARVRALDPGHRPDHHGQLGDAPHRRVPIRPLGRPVRPPQAADRQRAVLFGGGSALRPGPELCRVPRAAAALWHRHGGEWGVGASLALESVPARWRGLLSGFLQEGYALGNILAAVAYFTIFPAFGWRMLFFVGGLPGLLSLFILFKVKEPEAWEHARTDWATSRTSIFSNAKLFLYLLAL